MLHTLPLAQYLDLRLRGPSPLPGNLPDLVLLSLGWTWGPGAEHGTPAVLRHLKGSRGHAVACERVTRTLSERSCPWVGLSSRAGP